MPKLDYETIIGPDSATYGPQGSKVVYNTGALGGIVTIANVLVATIIVYALSRDASSTGVAVAIITGALYYGVTTSFALLVLSGSLAQIVTRRDEQITLRRYHILQAQQRSLPAADPVQTLYSLPPSSGSFVAPVDDSDARAGLAYIATLYGADGMPDTKRVVIGASDAGQEGRLRIANPPRSTLEWLVSRGLLQPITKRGTVNGYRLNTIAAPTLAEARQILRAALPPTPTSGG